MHGASIVALTMYDMLKPIDKEIEISTIKLVNKEGGKSSFKINFRMLLKPLFSFVPIQFLLEIKKIDLEKLLLKN